MAGLEGNLSTLTDGGFRHPQNAERMSEMSAAADLPGWRWNGDYSLVPPRNLAVSKRPSSGYRPK